MTEELLTPDEFAIEAGISRKTVYNYINEGKISAERHPATKRLMLPMSEVARLLGDGAQEAPTLASEPTPPPIKKPMTLHEFIINAIAVAHGQDIAKIVESKWDSRTEATLQFMTQTLQMKPNLPMIAQVIKSIPVAQAAATPGQAGLHPLTWLPALLTATSNVDGPAPDVAVPVPPPKGEPPPSYPEADKEFLPEEEEEEEEEEEKPAPPPRPRRVAKRPLRPVRAARRLESCPSCLQQNGAHASGCPEQRTPGGVKLKDGGMDASRIASPAASAAQAKALAERARRGRAGGMDLMDEFEECPDPANCVYPHRQVLMEGRVGHVTGHFLTEVEKVDEARGVFREMGTPGNVLPPQRASVTPPVASARRRRAPAKRASRRKRS